MRYTINKLALIDHLNSAANELYEKGAIVPSGILVILRDEIKEGKFDAPSDQGEVQKLRSALEKAEKFITAIMGFYGEGLSVYNWHQNGEGEPWDNFFDENMDGDELDVIRQALKESES